LRVKKCPGSSQARQGVRSDKDKCLKCQRRGSVVGTGRSKVAVPRVEGEKAGGVVKKPGGRSFFQEGGQARQMRKRVLARIGTGPHKPEVQEIGGEYTLGTKTRSLIVMCRKISKGFSFSG